MSAIPEACLQQHLGIVGKTGSGKSHTAKLAVEQVVAAGSRVCVLDPLKSDWWGLTSSADGRKPGLAFDILGGPRGHVPLHAGAGKAIGEIVASGALPLSILDMSEFGAGGQMQFFVDFAPALLKKMRGVLYLVIEEAHIFAPKERAGFGSENMAIHWAKTIASAGRSKGIRMIVLTQRTQALHNAVLGSCDTIITHRLTAPADQEPVVKWLKANVGDVEIRNEITSGMSSLKTGEGWICSGEAKIFEKRKFPKISTFDNSATPTDDSDVIEVKTAAVDKDKLRALIGDAVAEAEADDPKKLKARIRELETAPREVAVDAASLTAEYARGHADGFAAGAAKGAHLVARIRVRLHAAQTELEGINNFLIDETVGTAPALPARVPDSLSTSDLVDSLLVVGSDKPKAAAGTIIAKGELSILIACAQHGAGGCTRKQLTVLTGYKRSSRDAYISRLKAKEFIAEAGDDSIIATGRGLASLGDFEPLPRGRALREYWLQRLPDGERAILQHLCNMNGRAMERDNITTATTYKRSSRDAYISRLKARELVVAEGSLVKASPMLF